MIAAYRKSYSMANSQRGNVLRVCRKKHYNDFLKASLKSLRIDTSTWENAAPDRPKWRSEITMGATAAEKRRMAEAEEKR